MSVGNRGSKPVIPSRNVFKPISPAVAVVPPFSQATAALCQSNGEPQRMVRLVV